MGMPGVADGDTMEAKAQERASGSTLEKGPFDILP
jgi:hypothetical protein